MARPPYEILRSEHSEAALERTTPAPSLPPMQQINATPEEREAIQSAQGRSPGWTEHGGRVEQETSAIKWNAEAQRRLNAERQADTRIADTGGVTNQRQAAQPGEIDAKTARAMELLYAYEAGRGQAPDRQQEIGDKAQERQGRAGSAEVTDAKASRAEELVNSFERGNDRSRDNEIER